MFTSWAKGRVLPRSCPKTAHWTPTHNQNPTAAFFFSPYKVPNSPHLFASTYFPQNNPLTLPPEELFSSLLHATAGCACPDSLPPFPSSPGSLGVEYLICPCLALFLGKIFESPFLCFKGFSFDLLASFHFLPLTKCLAGRLSSPCLPWGLHLRFFRLR